MVHKTTDLEIFPLNFTESNTVIKCEIVNTTTEQTHCLRSERDKTSQAIMLY